MPTPDDLAAATLPTETNPAHEALAAKLRQASRLTDDGKPEGTREALERCVKMLDTYGPECFPANEKGQIHFARAMMESVADEITAHLSRVSALEAERDRLLDACDTARTVSNIPGHRPMYWIVKALDQYSSADIAAARARLSGATNG